MQLPLPQDETTMQELFSCMKLLDGHVCTEYGCRFYLALRQVPFMGDAKGQLYKGPHFFIVVSDRVSEAQVILTDDHESPEQAFQRQLQEWRNSHHCLGCTLCKTPQGGGNGVSASRTVQEGPRLLAVAVQLPPAEAQDETHLPHG